jgi:hypothetical protein
VFGNFVITFILYKFLISIYQIWRDDGQEDQQQVQGDQQAQGVQQAQEDQHAQGHQQQMTGPGSFLGFLFLMIVSIYM